MFWLTNKVARRQNQIFKRTEMLKTCYVMKIILNCQTEKNSGFPDLRF